MLLNGIIYDMRKRFTTVVIILSLISMGLSINFTAVTSGDADSWICTRGDSERRSNCDTTIHFPYSVSWDESIPQSHAVLVSNNYFVIIRATEAIVFHRVSKEELHTIDISGPCMPIIFENNLISIIDGKLRANKLSSGTLAYEISMVHGNPTFLLPSNKFMIATTDGGQLLKLSNTEIENNITLPDKATVCPVISGERIAIACDDFNIHLFDLSLKKIATSSTIGVVTDLVAFDGNSVVAIRERGGSVSITLDSARQLWSNLYPKGRSLHAVSDGNKVYLLGSDSGITSIRPDGRTAWSNRKISPTFSAISGRLLFVTTRDSKLYPVQTSTGQSHTPYKTPGNVTTMPTILRDSAFFICGPRVLQLGPSQYGTYLGFECNLDFDRLCPDKIYTRTISVKNICNQTITARVYCMVENASVSESKIKIFAGQTISVDVIINTIGILEFHERGELIIDTPAFRYRLGVLYDISQIPGDCNLDCRVDVTDLILIATCLGRRSYHSDYKAECDFDGNGIIDQLDIKILFDNFGVNRE